MNERHRRSALRARRSIVLGLHEPPAFRGALLGVPPNARDTWLDLVLGLDDLPDDGPELPRGCVPYLPCSVDAVLRAVEQAGVTASDVFVDIGAGLGRAVALVHLLTGASAIGLEIQPALARAARDLAWRVRLPRVRCLEGDATELIAHVTSGTVFFLYCPFGGERLGKVLEYLESLARTRSLRICCVDLPLPPCEWLAPETALDGDLMVYRSTLLPPLSAAGSGERAVGRPVA